MPVVETKCHVCGTQKAKRWYATLQETWCERHVPETIRVAADARAYERANRS